MCKKTEEIPLMQVEEVYHNNQWTKTLTELVEGNAVETSFSKDVKVKNKTHIAWA